MRCQFIFVFGVVCMLFLCAGEEEMDMGGEDDPFGGEDEELKEEEVDEEANPRRAPRSAVCSFLDPPSPPPHWISHPCLFVVFVVFAPERKSSTS